MLVFTKKNYNKSLLYVKNRKIKNIYTLYKNLDKIKSRGWGLTCNYYSRTNGHKIKVKMDGSEKMLDLRWSSLIGKKEQNEKSKQSLTIFLIEKKIWKFCSRCLHLYSWSAILNIAEKMLEYNVNQVY